MYILVSGATGQLGYEVCRELTERGIKTMGFGSKDCDICSREAVEQLFEREKPDVLIHCAAYTGVDKAEEDAERCWRVNAEGTGNLALACRKQGVKMLYVSTDYVFPGRGEDYYEPEITGDRSAQASLRSRCFWKNISLSARPGCSGGTAATL